MTEPQYVRYKLSELPESRVDWERLDRMTEEELEANALSDPDNPPLTDEQLANFILVRPGDHRKHLEHGDSPD